jgi:hypothetical protein
MVLLPKHSLGHETIEESKSGTAIGERLSALTSQRSTSAADGRTR